MAAVRRNPQPAHLLLGILQAEVGTVPRALSLKGVDRSELVGRIRQTLSVEG
jgi:D-alanyl-D-alanine carboxypeptidase